MKFTNPALFKVISFEEVVYMLLLVCLIDEIFLAFSETYICLSGQFKCTRKQKCIPLNLRCNGQDDCGDGEDETDCRKTPLQYCFQTHCLRDGLNVLLDRIVSKCIPI